MAINALQIDCRFLDALSDAILIYDKDLTILYASGPAAEILGIERETLMLKNCKDIFGEDFSDEIQPHSILEIKTDGSKRKVKVTKIVTPDNFNILIISPGPVIENQDILEGIVGVSKKMKEVFELIKIAARSDAPTLITGETGTGKELVAEAIHKLSSRKENLLVKINCSALPENLLESELFGYKKGAFTGADKDKPGKFEIANSGTLFLDEIGDLPLSLQPKILRAVERGEIEKLGETKPTKVNVRIISATNKDIEKEVSEGKFRPDLYFRISVFRIHIPPLRERKEDIIPIAELVLEKISKKYGLGRKFLTRRAIEELMEWDYPGNVRELENIIERAYFMSKTKNMNEDVIREHKKLSKAITNNNLNNETNGKEEKNIESISDKLKSKSEIEKEKILESLIKHGSISKAAKELNMSRVTIWRKMKKYGIEWK